MNEHKFDPTKDIYNAIFTQEKCAHCGDKISLDTYPLGIIIRARQQLLMYCSMKCQVADTLDQLVIHIEQNKILDVAWVPVIKQIHDQLEISEDE
jgi:hypothetical protein